MKSLQFAKYIILIRQSTATKDYGMAPDALAGCVAKLVNIACQKFTDASSSPEHLF